MKPLFETLCSVEHLRQAWQFIYKKKSAPGIDKITWQEYADNLDGKLSSLSESLKSHIWKPQPYMIVNIPKKDSSLREIGMMSIGDKVVQQGIKMLIEPILEKMFYNCSYAYRPGRGHLRAIRRSYHECRQPNNKWYLRLDIDDYFDNIQHSILFSRIRNAIKDAEICRLIELSIQMGALDSSETWKDKKIGIPQGAILSPLLANLYVTSFDQFVNGLTSSYVRYSDDFVLWCNDEETAKEYCAKITKHLDSKLNLRLNIPKIGKVSDGFEFLGITLNNSSISLSSAKKAELTERIKGIEIKDGKLSKKYFESLAGIERYYISVLSMDYLIEFTDYLKTTISAWIQSNYDVSLKKVLKIFEDIPLLGLLDKSRAKIIKDIYRSVHTEEQVPISEQKALNKKLIQQRKLEYLRRENDNSELIIASYGYYIGSSARGITLHKKGEQVPTPPSGALKHITVLSEGVTISSNAIQYCMKEGISIDFFDSHNNHLGAILSPKFLYTSLWEKQTNLALEKKLTLARKIIEGKLRNQINLIKYFHKYHKDIINLDETYVRVESAIKEQILNLKDIKAVETYQGYLMSCEAVSAVAYWDYIKELVADDNVGFLYREQQGARDIVNSMLNFGYSLLYPRIWQAILRHKLNPYVGLIHYQEGNANLVFDMIEMFRCQAVDRVVISMIQKKERLVIKDGRMDDDTRTSLAKNILERFNRYEKYRGENIRFVDIVDRQVKEIIAYITEGSIYRPYIAKW